MLILLIMFISKLNIDTSRLLTPGAHLICYPGAFNMTTGPLHWELLQRARYYCISEHVVEYYPEFCKKMHLMFFTCFDFMTQM